MRTKQGDDELIERLRKICLALPEANERVSHGEPTWFAGRGKVFAMLDNHHHGAPHLSVWLPQRHGVQARLIEEDPARYFRPPYTGPKGWVGVVLDTWPDWKLVAELVRDAYGFVASRKLVAVLETAAHPAAGVALDASRPQSAHRPARRVSSGSPVKPRRRAAPARATAPKRR